MGPVPRRRRLVRFASIATGVAFASPLALAGDNTLSQVRVQGSRAAFAVASAIRGAARLLDKPHCLQVFSDFHGADGFTLAQVLSVEGVTASDYLRRLLFYSGDDDAPCRKDALAWTTPKSRVVFICAARFRNAYETQPARVEAVIIHEMLHSLGLGENPPPSLEITARVAAACSGDAGVGQDKPSRLWHCGLRRESGDGRCG